MLIDGLNVACNNIYASSLKVGDESMSAILYQKMAKGYLPHLSYIFWKPDPLGKEFNKVACAVTGPLLFIEVQRGKEGINHINYQKELGATTACTKIMMEGTKGIGNNNIKRVTKDCFIFDSWFSSKKAAESEM